MELLELQIRNFHEFFDVVQRFSKLNSELNMLLRACASLGVSWREGEIESSLIATTELSFDSVKKSPRQNCIIESNKIICILQQFETKIENMEQVIECGSDYEVQDPDSLRKSEFSATDLINENQAVLR